MFNGTEHVRLYARYRPEYPAEMYDRIYGYLGSDRPWRLAVDVGCGSGQNARALVSKFERVVGVDTSEAQIAEARRYCENLSNLDFHCASASCLDGFLEDGSVDLITAAAALHWFDYMAFFRQCSKLLRPGGVLAAFCYALPLCFDNPLASEAFLQCYKTLGEYWAPQVKLAREFYKQPFAEMQTIFPHSERDDSYKIPVKQSIEELCGFVRSLSSYQTFRKENQEGSDPVAELSLKLRHLYGAELNDKDTVTGFFNIFMLLAKQS